MASFLSNIKYGFKPKLSPFADASGLDEGTVLFQLNYVKSQIDSYDTLILNLRNQIASQSRNGLAPDQLQASALQDKLAALINEQNNYKKQYDALMIQRDIVETDKIAAAQAPVISDKIGVPDVYSNQAAPTTVPVVNTGNVSQVSPKVAKQVKSSIGKNIFIAFIAYAAIYGIYKFTTKSKTSS